MSNGWAVRERAAGIGIDRSKRIMDLPSGSQQQQNFERHKSTRIITVIRTMLGFGTKLLVRAFVCLGTLPFILIYSYPGGCISSVKVIL